MDKPQSWQERGTMLETGNTKVPEVWYSIYEYSCINTDTGAQLIEMFDNREDAEHILKALEEVNKYFRHYKIIEKEYK